MAMVLNELLAHPAAKHHGQPVGWIYEDGKEYTACPDHAHDLRAEGIELTAVYTQQQHRGEPVAWRTGSIIWCHETDARRHAEASQMAAEPLFTHAATGEAEKWRNEAHRFNLEVERLNSLLSLNASLCSDIRADRDTLRAQLAERDTLLSAHTDHIAALCDVMFRHGLGMEKEAEQKIYAALRQQQVVFSTLSASAEPSAS